MSRRRILVLGSYPTRRPIHGGQVRLAQLVAAYQRHGFTVRQVNVFVPQPVYAHHGLGARLRGASFDLPLSGRRVQAAARGQVPFIEDLLSGQIVAADASSAAAIERYAGQVDWVHLEQPWLLPLVERLRQRGRLGRFRLIYGSQNIEHPLKRAIFEQYGVTHGEAVLADIASLESAAAGQADVVVAVTAADARQLGQWTQAPIVLAPNGVQPWTSSSRQRRSWLARLGEAPFALYVASAHPPNIQGFCEAFGESLAALSPTQRVVLAGSVAEHVLHAHWFRRWEALNARRVHVAGLLTHEELAALKDLTHTFVLPVTAGGGSNLKTAEALYAGRHVVATSLAMRGFEAFADLPGVTVVAPGPAFANAVSDSLGRRPPAASQQAATRREQLTWACTLSSLLTAIDVAVAG